MTVPRYVRFVDPILRLLAQRRTAVSAAEATEHASGELNLTDEDRKRRLASRKLLVRDRAGWAFNLLVRNGLGRTSTPGSWELTEAGHKLAASSAPLTEEKLKELEAGAARIAAGEELAATTKANAAVPREDETLGNRRAYRLPARHLVEGGQAYVFLATRKSDGRVVAFKKAKETIGENRMRREIEIQASLHHPNIMPVLDWDTARFHWFVMPLATQVMSDLPTPMDDRQLLAIVAEVVEGLRHAHGMGHAHRDIKPQNILQLNVAGELRWVVADWGLTRRALGDTRSKYTKTGEFFGTYDFAPPEARDDAHNIGPDGDIFSLGQVIAWAKGVKPVHNVSPLVCEPWRGLVESMTRLERDQRLQTTDDVIAMLGAIQSVSLSRLPCP